jgi:hypothetical protein
MEHRLNQATLAVEDLRASLHRFLLFAGGLVAMGIVVVVFFVVREQLRERVKPPAFNQYVQVPVKVGDKNVLIGVGVLNWEVPDELNGLMIDMEKLRLQEEEKAKGAKPDEKAKPEDKAKPGETPKPDDIAKPDEKAVGPPDAPASVPPPAPAPQPPTKN